MQLPCETFEDLGFYAFAEVVCFTLCRPGCRFPTGRERGAAKPWRQREEDPCRLAEGVVWVVDEQPTE